MSKILRNSAKCLACGDEIESKYRHDWVSCSCGAIFVDGGKAYLRRGGNPEDMEDTSIVENEDEPDEIHYGLVRELGGSWMTEFDEPFELNSGDRVVIPAYEESPMPKDGDRVEVHVYREGDNE